ncbi:PIR Superfamily Protein [Plasmodium ovale curtisi]|uniref:PIR Superfamily Protein n=1 Tax=Plasmodium ovale curtisi TaxID=864141 RepID=A0A1A8WQ81_PLAOA|nr:PIR Superfamily Protein [Plasmodium ovale curtisi]
MTMTLMYDELDIFPTEHHNYSFDFKRVIDMLYVALQDSDGTKLCEPTYREIKKDEFDKIKMVHDFSKDYEKYKIKIINADIICNNYKILPILSCIQEGTSRKIQLLSDKADRQRFLQEQASGHEPVTQLD